MGILNTISGWWRRYGPVISWWEPRVFARREAIRFVKKNVGTFCRLPFYGFAAMWALEWLVQNYFPIPASLPRSTFYFIAVLSGPLIFLFPIVLHIIIPRHITIYPSQDPKQSLSIYIQHGEHIECISLVHISRCSLRSVTKGSSRKVLMIKHLNRQGKQRIESIGMAAGIEPDAFSKIIELESHPDPDCHLVS